MKPKLIVGFGNQFRLERFQFLESFVEVFFADIDFVSCKFEIVLEMACFRGKQASVELAQAFWQVWDECCESFTRPSFDQCADQQHVQKMLGLFSSDGLS